MKSNDNKLMTGDEFVKYWCEPDESGYSLLDYLKEHLGECESQYLSECALFGDAGPGQGTEVERLKVDISRVESTLDYIGRMEAR